MATLYVFVDDEEFALVEFGEVVDTSYILDHFIGCSESELLEDMVDREYETFTVKGSF